MPIESPIANPAEPAGLHRRLACYNHRMDPLELFLPPVQQWFRAALGEPTPAQRQGWPAIAAGQHT